MDYGRLRTGLAHASCASLVRNYPGMRKDIEFWDDEFNSIPSWRGSDESVQSKYIPRGMIYNHAAGVRTFVWLLAAGVDGNEYDDFGFIHGFRNLPDDFTPAAGLLRACRTPMRFSPTLSWTPTIGIEAADIPNLRRQGRAPFLHYGFRNANGKAIIAYWIAAHSVPGGAFAPLTVDLTLKNSGIQKPVLIDVVSGEISPLDWKHGTTDTLEALPRARQRARDRRCELLRLAGPAGSAQRTRRTGIGLGGHVALGVARRQSVQGCDRAPRRKHRRMATHRHRIRRHDVHR